jgi:hypothetical protein
MSQFFASPTRPDTAAGAIAQHLRVKTAGALVVAGAGDVDLGTMEVPATEAGPASVRLRTAQGTAKMVAAGAISAGAPVYAAAGGEVSDTGTVYVGTAMEAATADGDVIEVLRGPNTDVSASTLAGTARVLRMRVSVAQINAGHTLLAAVTGYKYRVHDVALIAIGGAVTAATTVDILGTQSAASVKLLAAAVAGLTQNTLLRAGAANAAILAGGVSFVANDVSTAITIAKTGDPAATATHVDVLLTYSVEA